MVSPEVLKVLQILLTLGGSLFLLLCAVWWVLRH